MNDINVIYGLKETFAFVIRYLQEFRMDFKTKHMSYDQKGRKVDQLKLHFSLNLYLKLKLFPFCI